MSSFRRRPPTPADAGAVAELIAAADVAQQGFTDFGLADLEDEWRTSTSSGTRSCSSSPTAPSPPTERSSVADEVWIVDGYVHPRSQGRGAGRRLVTTLEAEAAGRGAHRVHNGVLAQDAAAHRLLESLGYRSVRRFWRMTIDLQEEPSQPEWPAHIVPEPFRLDAAEAFHAALEDGFADHWNHTPEPFEDFRRRKSREPRARPVAVARRALRTRDRRRGDLRCRPVRRRVGRRNFTRQEWRRRGVGEALLLDAFGKFWRAARAVSGSEWTRRTRRARRGSTSASECGSSGPRSSTRRRSVTALRELRSADADAVAALFEEAFGDARRLDAEVVRSWLSNRELRPEWLRVLERDGRVVGYGDLWFEGDDVALDVAAPGEWNPFFEWAEEEGRRRSLARVRVYFPAGHELERVAADRGYRLWRSTFTMEVALGDDAPPPGDPPAGIELASYREGDAEAVRAALDESFAEDPSHHATSAENFREFFLGSRGFDPSLWLLAWRGRSSPASRSPGQSVSASRGSAGWGRSACGRGGAGGVSGKRSCVRRSARSTNAACAASVWASTPRTSRTPCSCTNAWVCAPCAGTTSGSGSRERSAREVPRLRSEHGGRARRRLPVPQLRAGMGRRPRPRTTRVGSRRRFDGRGGVDAVAVAGGGDRRRGDAGRAGRAAAPGPPRPSACPRRMLLRSRRRGPWARAPPRPHRRRLDRRARGPRTRRRRPRRGTRGECLCAC